MRTSDIPEVRSLTLFSDMSDDSFTALMRAAYVQTFPSHVEIVSEGDDCDFLHIVVDGSVELFASWADRETSMAIVQPVNAFILAATIRDAPYLMSARTIEKTRLVLVPSMDVRAAFDTDKAFARAVVAELAQAYRKVVKGKKNLKLRTSIERLANYLLRMRAISGGTPEFELEMEKRRLASLLGMTPENLSRAFRALQPYGVEVDKSRVRIENPGDLIKLAKPTPLIDDPEH